MLDKKTKIVFVIGIVYTMACITLSQIPVLTAYGNQEIKLRNQNLTEHNQTNINCVIFSSNEILCGNVTYVLPVEVFSNITALNLNDSTQEQHITDNSDAITGNITQDVWVNETGDFMSGTLDMNTNEINNVSTLSFKSGDESFNIPIFVMIDDEIPLGEALAIKQGNEYIIMLNESFINFYSPLSAGAIFPHYNNQDDLGKSNRCFQDFYYYTLHDCGSPTQSVMSKKHALHIIDEIAFAHEQSFYASSDTEALDYYYKNMPEEILGDVGDCGHRVTNTDEIINALVLSISELNDRIIALEKK